MLRHTVGMMRELPRLHEIASVFIRHGLGDFVQRIGIAGVLERAGQILQLGRRRASRSTLEPAAAHAHGARGARTHIRQARPGDGDARRSVSAALDRRVREAAQRTCRRCRSRSCCRSWSARSGARRSRCSATSRRAPSRLGVDRAGASRASCRTARRSCSRCGGRASRAKVEADLRLLGASRAAGRIARCPKRGATSRCESSAQFARSLERELDFATEARNIERFAQNFAGDPYIVIPRIYPRVDERRAAGAGAHRRHSRRPIRAAVDARRPRPRSCSRRAAPTRS